MDITSCVQSHVCRAAIEYETESRYLLCLFCCYAIEIGDALWGGQAGGRGGRGIVGGVRLRVNWRAGAVVGCGSWRGEGEDGEGREEEEEEEEDGEEEEQDAVDDCGQCLYACLHEALGGHSGANVTRMDVSQ